MSRGLRFEKYDPSLHTMESLGLQLAEMTASDPHTRIAGSIGRAAFYERSGKGFDWEFLARQQAAVSKGKPSNLMARDVDVIAVSQPERDDYPFPIDYTAFCGNRGMIIEEQRGWWLVAPRHNFAEPISEDLLEPYEGEVAGHSFAALQPVAQFAVFSIHGNLRTQKIINARNLLKAGLEDQHIAVDDATLAPFHHLGKLNSNDMMHRIRYAYRRNVPEVVRKKLTGFSHAVSEVIDK